MSEAGRESPDRPFPRYRLLGTSIDALNRDEFFGAIGDAIDDGRRFRILNHNMHSLALCQNDAKLVEFFESADLIFIDGSPVVAVARALGYPVRYEHRLAVLDWFWPLIELSVNRGWRILHVGSHEAVIGEAVSRIRSRFPGVDFVTLPGFFDKRPGSSESDRVLEEIQAAAPDVILLGFGMPVQEHWLEAVEDLLPSRPVVTVGGILGFIGGERAPAPRWTGRFGLEWAYRLVTEPGRLWYRYLVEPWALLRPFATEFRSARRRGVRVAPR